MNIAAFAIITTAIIGIPDVIVIPTERSEWRDLFPFI